MNVDKPALYDGLYQQLSGNMERLVGPTQVLTVGDTLQFADYSKYISSMFDAEHKRRQHEEGFPADQQQRQRLGQPFDRSGRNAEEEKLDRCSKKALRSDSDRSAFWRVWRRRGQKQFLWGSQPILPAAVKQKAAGAWEKVIYSRGEMQSARVRACVMVRAKERQGSRVMGETPIAGRSSISVLCASVL